MKRMLGQSSLHAPFSTSEVSREAHVPIWKQGLLSSSPCKGDPYALSDSPVVIGGSSTRKVKDTSSKNLPYSSVKNTTSSEVSFEPSSGFTDFLKRDNVAVCTPSPVLKKIRLKPLFSPHPAAARSAQRLKESSYSTSALTPESRNHSVKLSTPKIEKGTPNASIRSSQRLRESPYSVSDMSVSRNILIRPQKMKEESTPLSREVPSSFASKSKFSLKDRSTSDVALLKRVKGKQRRQHTTEDDLFLTPPIKRKTFPEIKGVRSSPRLQLRGNSSSDLSVNRLGSMSESRPYQKDKLFSAYLVQRRCKSVSPSGNKELEKIPKFAKSYNDSPSTSMHVYAPNRPLERYKSQSIVCDTPKRSKAESNQLREKLLRSVTCSNLKRSMATDVSKLAEPVIVAPETIKSPGLPKLSKQSSKAKLKKHKSISKNIHEVEIPMGTPELKTIHSNSKNVEKTKIASPVKQVVEPQTSSKIQNEEVCCNDQDSQFTNVCNNINTNPSLLEGDLAVFNEDFSDGYMSAEETTTVSCSTSDQNAFMPPSPTRLQSSDSDYFSVSSQCFLEKAPTSSIMKVPEPNRNSTGSSIFSSSDEDLGTASGGSNTLRNNRVKFNNVKVFYFEREAGGATVPENGEFALGMKSEHFKTKSFDLLVRRRPNLTLFDEEEDIEEDEILPEYDEEYCSTIRMTRIDAKQRVQMLRRHGIPLEKCEESLEDIRKSRKLVGCSCTGGACQPDTCECSKNGIHCQVDGTSDNGATTTPCTCYHPSKCDNPNGRSEFREDIVKQHYLLTFKRIKDMNRTGNYASPNVIKFDDDGEVESPKLYYNSIVVKHSNSSQKTSSKSTTVPFRTDFLKNEHANLFLPSPSFL